MKNLQMKEGMVAILERIKLVMKNGIMHVNNHIGEKYIELLSDSEFSFEKGTIYGVIGESGAGGETISSLLSGRIISDNAGIYYDNIKADNKDIQSKGWYVGKVEYSDGIFQRDISVKQAINKAIRRYNRYENINEVIQEFGLTQGRVEYKLSKYSGERLRASLAIGYASNKIVYCFPWMNTAYFYDIILSSGVFRFFNKLKEEGCIIILPTSREENVNGFVDKVININNPKFNYILSENQYFIQNIKRDNRPDFS